MAALPTTDPVELTVDELARQAQLPVRTIREYQTLRLLPPPHRRGRIGLYGQEHVERLAVIARLQRRGYSLAGIKDLLAAWTVGTDLSGLLGVDVAPAALDEMPLRLEKGELQARLPGLTAAQLRHAGRVGLVQPDGKQHYLVRSPALLALVADTIAAGTPVVRALDLVGVLRHGLAALANSIADRVVEDLVGPLRGQGRVGELPLVLRRDRLLLLQGVVSTFADRLGDALQTVDGADGEVLRDAIEQVRVGAVTDTAGNIEHRSRS